MRSALLRTPCCGRRATRHFRQRRTCSRYKGGKSLWVRRLTSSQSEVRIAAALRVNCANNGNKEAFVVCAYNCSCLRTQLQAAQGVWCDSLVLCGATGEGGGALCTDLGAWARGSAANEPRTPTRMRLVVCTCFMTIIDELGLLYTLESFDTDSCGSTRRRRRRIRARCTPLLSPRQVVSLRSRISMRDDNDRGVGGGGRGEIVT